MLETIREAAAERLAASGEAGAVRDAHAAYFLGYAERHELVPLVPFDEQRLIRLEAERANFAAALTWLDETADDPRLLRLVAALGWFWWVHGDVLDGRAWLERAAARDVPEATALRAKVAVVLGFMAFAASDDRRAEQAFSEALARFRALGDARGVVHALTSLGSVDNQRGDYSRAQARFAAALSLARSIEHPGWAAVATGRVYGNLGNAVHGQGQPTLAAAHYDEALRLQRPIGYTFGVMHDLVDLGDARRDLGDLARAGACYREGLLFARPYGQTRVVIGALEGIAGVSAASGQATRAARLYGAVEQFRETTGVTDLLPINRVIHERAVAAVRTALGETAFGTASAAGRALRMEQVVADALDVPVDIPGSTGVTLTKREAEVLRLLAAGGSDRAIGETLFISRRTVESHVGRIYQKLGVRTRAAATAVAIATGLAAPPPPPESPRAR